MIATYSSVSLEGLSDLSSDEILILTVNNRHARRILAEFSAGLNDAQGVMAVPDIVPLSAWLRQAGDQLSFVPEAELAGNTLDAFGSQYLWQRVIGEAESEDRLLDVMQAARLAAEADRLLDEWQIQVTPERETADYQRFEGWRERYRAVQLELDLEDSNLTYERIRSAVAQGQLALPFTTLVLAGFNELSPRFSDLIQSMERQGIQVLAWAHPRQSAAHVYRIAVSDPDAEWRQAAHWAARELKRNSTGRYAIVSARLEADVVLAHRTLQMGLGQDESGKPIPYNVAVARPLGQWPLVRAALAWLRVFSAFSQRRLCTPADLGQALLAGACAGGDRESSGRALMDAMWRKQAKIQVPLAEFIVLLQHHAPRLATVWEAGESLLEDYSGSKTIDAWVAGFRRWLEILGFPGRALDSHEYQVMEAFDQLLERLGRQAAVVGKIGFATAVGMLGRLARETVFQPQRDPAARLDVLGFLESEGGQWDGVWVLGLTDEVLPAAPKPNPFIPVAALRDAEAPRATPERELHWAQTMYAALLTCAPRVWLSHAQHEGERQLRPSPCIAALPVTDSEILVTAASSSCTLEYLIDERGPALQPGSVTRGGIGVLDTQARNPLWAFVKYRLGASELRDYADLADQNARGLFLHRAVELVWGGVKDQIALQELHVSGRLADLVGPCIEQAAHECLEDYGKTWRKLETERAMTVVQDWLTRELLRQPFHVRDVEQSYEWTHHALTLSLRLDRIDRLSDGRLAVIDYKTGMGNIDPRSDWMRVRPIGLQLPFYAAVLANSADVDAVAALVLVKLHARSIETKGLADVELGLEGVAALQDWPAFAQMTWPALMAQWRQTIEGFAQEYCAGDARNVSLRAEDIRYCDVLPFLRLNEEYPRDR